MSGADSLLVLVPARSARDEAPLFLQELGGGRLIDPTLADAEALLGSRNVDLCVTTDDPRLAEYVSQRNQHWHVRQREQAELDGDYFYCLEVAHKWMSIKFEKKYDAVLILEPTHPFRPEGLIGNALNLLDREVGLDTVVSVVAEYGNIWTEEAGSQLRRLATPAGRHFFREIAGLCLLTTPDTLAGDAAMGQSVGFVVVEEQWALIDIHGASGVDLARRYYDVLIHETGDSRS